MKSYLEELLAVGVLSSVSACASTPAPAVRATGVERMQCDASVAAHDDLVRSTRVLAVEPLYVPCHDIA